MNSLPKWNKRIIYRRFTNFDRQRRPWWPTEISRVSTKSRKNPSAKPSRRHRKSIWKSKIERRKVFDVVFSSFSAGPLRRSQRKSFECVRRFSPNCWKCRTFARFDRFSSPFWSFSFCKWRWPICSRTAREWRKRNSATTSLLRLALIFASMWSDGISPIFRRVFVSGFSSFSARRSSFIRAFTIGRINDWIISVRRVCFSSIGSVWSVTVVTSACFSTIRSIGF